MTFDRPAAEDDVAGVEDYRLAGGDGFLGVGEHDFGGVAGVREYLAPGRRGG